MMNFKKNLVSILIPCYNHEKYVKDCLQSILHQTYCDYEVIICDDCSRDKSVEIIQQQKTEFDKKGIRLLLIENQQNKGLTPNINGMLQHAEGEYIKIIASDDMLAENYLEEMVAVLAKDDSLKFAFSNGRKVKEEAEYPMKQEWMDAALFETLPDCRNNVVERIFVDNFIPAPSILFRHSVLEEVEGYDEQIGIEDLEMSLRVLSRYPEGLGATEKQLVYYRINENSMTSVKNNAGAKRRIRFMYKNCMAIARKYRKSVTKKTYYKRMLDLKLSYLFQMRDILLGRS